MVNVLGQNSTFAATCKRRGIELIVGLLSFTITWYAMQYVYTPIPRSETQSILKIYESQGCVRNPDFIPANIVIWEDERLKFVPFDSFDHQIALFCP